MKFDASEYIKNPKLALKFSIFFAALIIATTPGALFLFAIDRSMFVSLEVMKIFMLSAILSIPFYFLGALIVHAPMKSFIDIMSQPPIKRAILVASTSIIWAMLSVGFVLLAKYIFSSGFEQHFGINQYGTMLIMYGSFLLIIITKVSDNVRKFNAVEKTPK